MNIELSRFRVRPGAMSKVGQWLEFLNQNMDAVLQTLDGENMLVETIFHEHLDGVDYLYWFSIQNAGGIAITDSTHWIDVKHLEYWRACIDDSYTHIDLTPKVTMIPKPIRASFINA
ncbi:hypothetical protein CQ018_01625 [Arthrobacter sp. MYb227]|uniref:DUF6176 family protein n=1 Tax=Arthrobacter sp. MYb227 TaxID=1848601 RepID=UPI000CFD1223|nr:DUF6176 family protein [Arthrobacter sp. MYb227]PQZ96012.1 hypothetical protein CQ018_01625 [Arthrobacter sp. MYb227]